MTTATAQAPAIDLLTPSSHQPPAIRQTGTVLNPQALIDMAMANGQPNLDQLERLLNLQQKWQEGEREQQRYEDARTREREEREAELSFRRDLVKFRGKNVVVPKTKFVDRGKAGSFMQAEFDRVCSMLSPALADCNFSFRHDQRFGVKEWPADGSNPAVPAGTILQLPWCYVTCFLEHADGHSERLNLDGPPGDDTANTPVQNMQKTASMLKRLSLLAITGTATGGEDEESQARAKAAAESRQESELEALRAEGQDKAMGGMDSLLAWWRTVSSKHRNLLSPDYPKWRRAAETADKNGKKGGAA